MRDHPSDFEEGTTDPDGVCVDTVQVQVQVHVQDGTIGPADGDVRPYCRLVGEAEHGGMKPRSTKPRRRCYERIWGMAAGVGCAMGMFAMLQSTGALVTASVFASAAVLE